MEKVKATPTKEFFISMLTRDVPLDRAVLDLVDNSIDAAYLAGDIKNKAIDIAISRDEFRITDNCGGMDKEVAIKYAFKFGRSKADARETPNSVGQFGVGMKRTLFKIGRQFSVKSSHPNGSFVIDVDVDKWLEDPDDWDFSLAPTETEDTHGTSIKVTRLLEGVSQNFSTELFVKQILNDIEKAHFKAIRKGVVIKVNGAEAGRYDISFKTSVFLQPICIVKEYNGVEYKIIAGVSDRILEEGGWYIICNGRLIEYANTNTKTGWGQAGIRKYHPDYAYFRGIVEFNAAESELLPWTTTKTGVDVDNSVYRKALNDMKAAMKEVMSFLNKRQKEDEDFKNELIEHKPLNEALDNAQVVGFEEVEINHSMVTPNTAIRQPDPDPSVSVQYRVKKKRIDRLKEVLGLDTNKEVGEHTFEYVFEQEVGDE
jgi:hypothetical protein